MSCSGSELLLQMMTRGRAVAWNYLQELQQNAGLVTGMMTKRNCYVHDICLERWPGIAAGSCIYSRSSCQASWSHDMLQKTKVRCLASPGPYDELLPLTSSRLQFFPGVVATSSGHVQASGLELWSGARARPRVFSVSSCREVGKMWADAEFLPQAIARNSGKAPGCCKKLWPGTLAGCRPSATSYDYVQLLDSGEELLQGAWPDTTPLPTLPPAIKPIG